MTVCALDTCSAYCICLQGVLEFPLEPGYLPMNYSNSEGLGYEAEEVRNCLQQGKKESDIMPLRQTQLVAEIMDSVMKQLGVVYYEQRSKI